jgi:hypothetical protein
LAKWLSDPKANAKSHFAKPETVIGKLTNAFQNHSAL